jgi:MoaA/NifB/PqqE/SkfB family radical SAM enzyme
MKLRDKLWAAKSVLQARICGKRTPLIVSWAVTTRCNLRCRYCNAWNAKEKELGTSQILAVIEELSEMGTKKIQLTGGEPLLRDDIGQILNFCQDKGMSTSVNSNGMLVEERKKVLKNIDLLCLSFDGRKAAHDYVRGEGSYDRVIQAVKIAKDNNIKIRFVTVLGSHNLNEIDFILQKAEEFKTTVFFQPTTENILKSKEPNPVVAGEEGYKKTMAELLTKKKKNRHIANSIAGLNHLYNWPKKTMITCHKYLVCCRIESNGDVYICPRMKEKVRTVNCIEKGFREAFYNLPSVTCDSCWCAASVEINCLLAFRPSAMLNMTKLV